METQQPSTVPQEEILIQFHPNIHHPRILENYRRKVRDLMEGVDKRSFLFISTDTPNTLILQFPYWRCMYGAYEQLVAALGTIPEGKANHITLSKRSTKL